MRAEPDHPKVWNLWIINLATGEQRRLTSYRYGQPWGGSWFPDGKRIAYSHEDRLVVLNLATGASRIYPSPRKGALVRTPAVSPDGTRAVFQVFHAGTWLLDFKSGAMKKVSGRSIRRGIRMGARRPPRRLPQPFGGQVGRVDHDETDLTIGIL